MKTRKQILADNERLSAQLAVHQHETRKGLKAKITQLESDKKFLEQRVLEQGEKIAKLAKTS